MTGTRNTLAAPNRRTGTAEPPPTWNPGRRPDARRVLIFTEPSHWDPDGLSTADEYSERFVRGNLTQAITALERQPRPAVRLSIYHMEVSKTTLCDARERDMGRLEVRGATVRLSMPGAIVTVRPEHG